MEEGFAGALSKVNDGKYLSLMYLKVPTGGVSMEVGQKVPDFSGVATDGSTFSLSQALAENKAVVITTFPLCFTGN